MQIDQINRIHTWCITICGHLQTQSYTKNCLWNSLICCAIVYAWKPKCRISFKQFLNVDSIPLRRYVISPEQSILDFTRIGIMICAYNECM